MRVLLSYQILTLGTDGNRVNNIISQNTSCTNLMKVIQDYNDNYPLVTYPKKTIFNIVKDIKQLVDDCLASINLKHFYFVNEGSTVFKVQKSKIYQLNDSDKYINKDVMLQAFNATFNEYYQKGLISRSDYENNLNEDFVCINIAILEKGHPIAIIEPGEISGKISLSPDCWNFIARMRIEQESSIEENIDDDDEDDYEEYNDWNW